MAAFLTYFPRQPGRLRWLFIFIGLALLAVPPASPFFLDGVPRTNDLFPHLHRVVALDQALRWDGLWPRWSPDLVHGYGYPVFNFFPQLSHLLVVGIARLGVSFPAAYRIAVYLLFFGSAGSSFWLGRRLFKHDLAAWSVALVYTYSPYLLYDALVRGSLPESQALALLPLLVGGVYGLCTGNAAWRERLLSWEFGGTAVVFCAMILSHQAVTLQICFPLGLWLLALSLPQPFANGGFRRWGVRLLVTGGSLLLGAALSSFFSLPSLLDIEHTRAAVSINQGYSFSANFLPLSTLFRLPALPADPARINPPVVWALPLVGVLWLVSLPFAWPRLDAVKRRLAVATGLALLMAVWWITPSAALVWETLPLLPYTLYPWRLLSFASLAVALLVALTLTPLASNKPYAVACSLLLTGLVTLSTVPWLYPPREPLSAELSIADVVAAEIPPLFIGTTTLGEYLPLSVAQLPDTQTLQQPLIAGENPDRLQPQAGVEWERLSQNPLAARYALSSPSPTTLVYRQFAFPGWEATLNGEPWPLRAGQPHGLLTIDLPAGQHQLDIRFGSTPQRRAAEAVSLLALLGLSGWGWLAATAARKRKPQPDKPVPQTNGRWLLGLALLASAIWGTTTLLPTPLHRPTLDALGAPNGAPFTRLDYAGELWLLGYTQSDTRIAGDQPVEITLYWQPQRPLGVDYITGIQVVDAQGLRWDQAQERPFDWRFVAGEEPWPLDGYRLDPFVVQLRDGTPPGDYQFLVGMVRRDTGETVDFHLIGQIEVIRPTSGPSTELEAGMRAHDASAQGLHLLGSRADREEARPGDLLRLTLLWLVTDTQAASEMVVVSLRDESGDVVYQEQVPIAPTYPREAWQVEDRLRTEHTLRLPAALSSGTFRWEVSWGDTAEALYPLTLTLPERIFSLEGLPRNIERPLGELTVLRGAEIPPALTPNVMLPVTLFWQARSQTNESLHVFLHLVGPQGDIIAQSDGEPASWQRPTTSWLPGEVIIDAHVLPIPATLTTGQYQLRAGLYDPRSGRRLATPEGDDNIVLATLELEE